MAKKKKEEKLVYVDSRGKRLDGRKTDEVRPINLEVGVLSRADGSCYIEWGQNKIVATVYGPKECLPKHTADAYKSNVRYTYRMATFSVPDRKRPQPARREIEIGKVSGEALERAVFVERFPNTAIDVGVEVLDSNAGTRVAALTAAALALANAGVPMRDLVAGCGVGMAGGKVMVDLDKDEEDADDAVDIPLAIMPNTEEIVLLQLDGLIKKVQLKEALELGIKKCKEIYEIQTAALKAKYTADLAAAAANPSGNKGELNE